MDKTNTRAIYVSSSNSLKSAAECVTDLTDSQKGHHGIKTPSIFQHKLILRTFHCTNICDVTSRNNKRQL